MLFCRLALAAITAMILSACANDGNLSATRFSNAPESVLSFAGERPIDAVGLRGCARQAVFVRLPAQIRGYPLTASGSTTPCTIVAGPQTLLLDYGSLAVSVNGYLHSTAFQSNAYGGLLVFAPNADGNAIPSRAVAVDQDHVALAVDSKINDYVVASQGYAFDNCWYVVPSGALKPSRSNCDTNLGAIHALATTPRDELVVLGTDATTNATRIDVYAHPASTAPSLVRTISGDATGLPTDNSYFDLNVSVAVDPVSGAMYILSADQRVKSAAKVSEFAANASGNVAPFRTLAGSRTMLPSNSFAIDLLAVDAADNLYVNASQGGSGNVVITIFAPNTSGNAAPSRMIEDRGVTTGGSGGIAVRF